MKDLSGELERMDNKNILSRIEKLERSLKALQNSSIKTNSLSDISDNLGEVRAGDILATEQESGYPDDGTYTGCFMSANGYTIGTTNYHLGGMNNGTLQWGANNSDGNFRAGGSAILINSNGINIYRDAEIVSGPNTIKFRRSDGTILGYVYGDWGGFDSSMIVRSQAAGTTNNTVVQLLANGYSKFSSILVAPTLIDIATENTIRIGQSGGTIPPSTLAENGIIYSGSYTPTLTKVTNVATATAFTTYYSRIGAVMNVFGLLNVGGSAVGACELDISLPVASNFVSQYNCAGVAANNNDNIAMRIDAGTAADVARMFWSSAGTVIRTISFNFSYVIL
jgi:hypothetical protein